MWNFKDGDPKKQYFWPKCANMQNRKIISLKLNFLKKCPRYKRSTLCLKRGLFFSEP